MFTCVVGGVETVIISYSELKALYFLLTADIVVLARKQPFKTHTQGDIHSGLSADVYGPLLSEIASPIICSALFVDSSACVVWLD